MARDRGGVADFGPKKLTLTHTSAAAASAWTKLGPFNAANLGVTFVFSPATSGQSVRLQGTISTGIGAATTAFCKTLAGLQTGDNSGIYQHSTYTTGVFSYVRLVSTAGTTGHAVTAYFNAVP